MMKEPLPIEFSRDFFDAKLKQLLKDDTLVKEVKQAIRDWLPERKDITGNFDVDENGGITRPEGSAGVEYALQFAEWTGYNECIEDLYRTFRL